MLRLRKIFFYLFFLLYCLLCPVTILYALGYILTPGAEHGLTKAGLVYLSTSPDGASVFVENKRFSEKTPTMIRGLLPGNYRLGVSMKGYRSWTRTVAIEPEKAVTFDKLILLPKSWPRTELPEGEFEDLAPMKNSRFLLLFKGPALEDLFFYDTKEKTLLPAVSADFSFKTARLTAYLLEEDGENILVRAQMGLWGEEKFFWIEPLARKGKVKDVTTLFRDKPRFVDWDRRRPGQFFAFRGGVLSRLDMSTGDVYAGFANDIVAYGLSDKKLFFAGKDSGFVKTDFEGKSRDDLKADPVWMKALLSEQDTFKIKVIGRRFLFVGERGEILSSEPPFRLAGEGVRDMEPDEDQRRILLRTDDRIGFLDFTPQPETPADYAAARWWKFQGKKIRQIFWAYDGSHVLFLDEDEVCLVDLADGMGAEPEKCFEVKHGSSIFYSERTGKIYFLEKNSGRFCVTDLLPKKVPLPGPAEGKAP